MEDDQPLPKKKKILNEVEKAEEKPEDLVVKKLKELHDDKDEDEEDEAPKDLVVKKGLDPKASKNGGSDSDHDEDNGDDDKEEEDEPDRIDKEGDRNYNDKLVGEKIRGNYENGWHTGTIQWFNTDFLEYRVLFEDGSEDYISTDDIDGVDIVLVPSQKFKNSNNKGPKSPLVRDDASDSDYDEDDSDDEPAPKKRTNNVAKKPAAKKPAAKKPVGKPKGRPKAQAKPKPKPGPSRKAHEDESDEEDEDDDEGDSESEEEEEEDDD